MSDLQRTLIEYLIADVNVFTRASAIIQPQYFDRGPLAETVDFIKNYAERYHAVPDLAQIKATTGVQLSPVANFDDRKANWALDEIEKYCKRQALRQVIYEGVELVDAGEFGALEQNIKSAMQISLQKNLGTAYYADPKGRAAKLRDRNNIVSTGWKSLDDILYGGFNRGELNLFAGSSGAGKSTILQNISRHWSAMGLVVVYFTLELSEELIAQRLDAMNTRLPTRMLWPNIDDVELKIKMMGRKAGHLQIVYMPAGTTVNVLRAFMREWEIQTGLKADAVVVDYLDLLHPNNGKIDVSNLFIKDKYVSEELRGFLAEELYLSATASQLNRSAADLDEKSGHSQSHISGGISKINTADNLLTIYAPDKYKEKGQIRLQAVKTRNSAGVGKKIFLRYDVDCMVIEDFEPGMGPETDDSPDDVDIMERVASVQKVRSAINARRGSDGSTGSASPSEKAEQSKKLRNFIKRV